jgi:hypothetical protein
VIGALLDRAREALPKRRRQLGLYSVLELDCRDVTYKLLEIGFRDRPANGPEPLGYVILKNGQQIHLVAQCLQLPSEK